MEKENLPSLITLEKICKALDITLSKFFQIEKENDLTEKEEEILEIWNNLEKKEQEVVIAMLRGLQRKVKQGNGSKCVS